MDETNIDRACFYAMTHIGQNPVSINSWNIQHALEDILKLYKVKDLDYIIQLYPNKHKQYDDLSYTGLFGKKADKIEAIKAEIIKHAPDFFGKMSDLEKKAYDYCIKCQETYCFWNTRPELTELTEIEFNTAIAMMMSKGLLFQFVESKVREYIVVPNELIEIYKKVNT